MKRLLIALLILGANTATAEIVTARAGEHSDFTRLVFYYPKDSNWSFDEQRRRGVLSFDSGVTGFDTTGVFPRIPRDRLRNIVLATNGSRATLEFACDCEPTAWQHDEGIMVVDIYDGTDSQPTTSATPQLRYARTTPTNRSQRFTPLGQAETEAPLAYNTVRDPGALTFGISLTNRSTPRTVADIRPRTRASEAPQPRQTPRPTQSTQSSAPPPQPTALPQSPDDMLGLFRRERVSEAQEQLLEQIIRGVAQGSLQADFDPTLYTPPPSPTPTAEPIETEVVALSSAATEPEQTIEEAELPLRAETTIDRDSAIAEEALRARGCVPASDLNFTGMMPADRFSAALAEARANQARVSAEQRPIADETLALTYMYWGFGAEAIQTVLASDLPDRRRNQLIAQAEIIDWGYAENPLGLGAHPGCPGPSAFWSLMAPEEWPGGLRVSPRDILSTFNALPPHLRRHLGPKLVERLITVDAIDVAQEVQRILLREQPDASPAMQLSSARIAVAGGDAEVSEDELASIARGGTDEAPRALLDVTDLMLAREELIPDDLVDLLAAYAFENRGTTLGERLQGNRALALTRANQVRAALKIVDDELSEADVLAHTRETMFDFATKYADDSSFLRLALSRIKEEVDLVSPITSNAVARRVLELGFPDQATFFLEGEAEGPQAIARQFLKAEAALQLKRPADVEVYLLGIDNEMAARMRAEAQAMLDDHDYAYEAFSALGAREEAERQAVLGRDWQRLTASDDDVLRRAASVLAHQDEPNLEPGLPSLASSRALIEGSENTRDVLGDLILRFAPRDEF